MNLHRWKSIEDDLSLYLVDSKDSSIWFKNPEYKIRVIISRLIDINDFIYLKWPYKLLFCQYGLIYNTIPTSNQRENWMVSINRFYSRIKLHRPFKTFITCIIILRRPTVIDYSPIGHRFLLHKIFDIRNCQISYE